MSIDTKVVRLPLALAERLSALSVEDRARVVERGFEVSSNGVVEPAPTPGPALAVADSGVVSAQASRPAPHAWVSVSVQVPARLRAIFDSLDHQTKSAFLEFCVAGAKDLTHVERIAAQQYEFTKLARQLRKLLKIFSLGEARAPHLERRLLAAIHRWANKTLDLVGEPLLDLPGVGLANAKVAGRVGVPSSYEPVTVWLPARMVWRLDEVQAQLVATYAAQEAKWDEYYRNAFIHPPVSEKTFESAPPVEVVEPGEPPQENGREAAP